MVDEEIFYQGIAEIAESFRQNTLKVLIAFILGFLSTVIALRLYLFNAIQNQSLRFALARGYQVEIAYINPFEVILLQAKIGIIIGVLFVFPFIVYPIVKRKDILRLNTKKGFIIGIVAIILFILGGYYAYYFMVPFLLEFISFIAVEAGVQPFFRISSFINFVFIYTLFLGVMFQIPLLMVILVRANIVSYNFIRQKWRHFVIATSILAAIATPPDPITQITVLGPIIIIYFIGIISVRIFAADKIKQEKQQKKKQEKQQKKKQKQSENKGTKQKDIPIKDSAESLIDQEIIDVFKAIENEIKRRRRRLILISIVSTVAAFWWLVFFGIEEIINHTFSYIPQDISTEVFTVQLKIFELLFLVTKYSILVGLIAFILPTLYYSHRSLINHGIINKNISRIKYFSYILFIFILFIIGGVLAYIVGIPILISFLSNSIVSNGMNATYSITDLVNFVILICIIVGVIAEMPAAMYFLVSSRIADYSTLKEKWRHFIFGSLIIGALVTGPDPFTAVAVAIPLSVFYLLSLISTRILCRSTIKKTREERKNITTID